MKYLLMLDTPFWLLVSSTLTVYIFALRRRMRGLKEPELWLPRRERRAHARKMLAREEEQYRQQVLEELDSFINKRK
jgi:hypothetical protein